MQNLPCAKSAPPPRAEGMLRGRGDRDPHPLRLPSPSSILGCHRHKQARGGLQHGEGDRCALIEGAGEGAAPGACPKAAGSDLWQLPKALQAHTPHPQLLAEPSPAPAAATRNLPPRNLPAFRLHFAFLNRRNGNKKFQTQGFLHFSNIDIFKIRPVSLTLRCYKTHFTPPDGTNNCLLPSFPFHINY